MMIKEQDVLSTKDGCHKLLKMIADEKLQEKVKAEIFEVNTSQERWDKFVAVAESYNIQTVCILIYHRIKTYLYNLD